MKHNLTNKELELFTYFTLNYGRVITCKEMIDAIWGGIGHIGTVRKCIYLLRQKLPYKIVIRNVSTNMYMMDSICMD